MTNPERSEALRDLVELRVPVGDAVDALAVYAWDSEHELARVSRSDARRLLDAYLGKRISIAEVVRWAEAIEGRDDLSFEPGSEDILKDFIFELATPEIVEPLSVARASWWMTHFPDAGDSQGGKARRCE